MFEKTFFTISPSRIPTMLWLSVCRSSNGCPTTFCFEMFFSSQ